MLYAGLCTPAGSFLLLFFGHSPVLYDRSKKESNKSKKLTKFQQLKRDSYHYNKYFSTTAATSDDVIRKDRKEIMEQRKMKRQN